MAKKTYTWMPTKEGGSKATVKTSNADMPTQGWKVQPLIIDGTTYFQLQHCARNPDYAPTDAWTLMTRKHGIKSNTKRTTQPLNPTIGQGCESYILEKNYTGIKGVRLNELVFLFLADAQTFAEETLLFSMTTVCV